jgi:hypothetical protein
MLLGDGRSPSRFEARPVNWLRTVRLHATAKRYALELPKHLQDAYLHSEFYTRSQIDHAVTTLKLPRNYVWLAYAAYLPKIAYDGIQAELNLPLNYEDARFEFYKHVPEPEDEWNPLKTPSLGGVPYSK